jgi:hypothetical protein
MTAMLTVKIDVDPVYEVTFKAVWKAMHATASKAANEAAAPAWLSPCQTTPICVSNGNHELVCLDLRIKRWPELQHCNA